MGLAPKSVVLQVSGTAIRGDKVEIRRGRGKIGTQ